VLAGVRGAHVTIGRQGTRLTAGLPGSELSYTTLLPTPPAAKPAPRRRHPALVIVALILFGVALALAG
jgi:hypothetical protein